MPSGNNSKTKFSLKTPSETDSKSELGNQAVKYDGEKPRFDLVPALPLIDLAKVYTMGANKYADRNWEYGLHWGRIYSGVMRHLQRFWAGEDLDPESGLPHVTHATWGLFTLREYMQTNRYMDDRSFNKHIFDEIDYSVRKVGK